MQAPTWTKRFDPGQFRLFLIAIAAIAILLVGAALSTTLSSGNDRPAAVDLDTNSVTQPTSNTRFLGWNILPGDPGTYPVTSQQEHRFRDWNVLPGDPGTHAATSLREYRFRDWNILPGDDSALIPPDYERGTRH